MSLVSFELFCWILTSTGLSDAYPIRAIFDVVYASRNGYSESATEDLLDKIPYIITLLGHIGNLVNDILFCPCIRTENIANVDFFGRDPLYFPRLSQLL